MRIETIDGKKCIRVTFSGKDTPYFAYGRAYMRVADEDRQLTARELENAPDAKFREVAQIFIACFDRPSFVESDEQSTPKTKGKTKGKAKGKAEALLNFLAKNLSATIPEMAAELNLTENGVNYHLRKLQQTNRLKRVGGRKQGHWQVL